MKTSQKIITWILSIVAILFIAVLSLILITNYLEYRSQQNAINEIPAQFQQLAKSCENTTSFSCCMSSVNTIAKNNYTVITPDEKCPQNYSRNMNKCEDSYIWCEPIAK